MPLNVKLVKPHAPGCKGTRWFHYQTVWRGPSGMRDGKLRWLVYLCQDERGVGCPAEVLVREDSITAAVEAALKGKAER